MKYAKRRAGYTISLIILCFLVILTGNKMNHIIKKIALVQKAEIAYHKEEWIEAEEALQKAQKYKWFNYKEQLAKEYLNRLDFITKFKPLMDQMLQDLKLSYTIDQYEAFAELYKGYQTFGLEKMDQFKRDYLLKQYPLEEAFHKGWKVFKEKMEKGLNDPVNNPEYNWAKQAIWDLPDEYLKGDKETHIKELFIACDTKLFEEAAKGNEDFLHFQKLLTKTNDIYIINKKYSYNSEWLTVKLKPYIERVIKEKSKTDNIREFARYVKAYEANVIPYYESKDVRERIKTFIEEKEKKAELFVERQEYEEAIKIFEDMNAFGNYSKEIEQVKKRQKYDHEELLLAFSEDSYGLIRKGTGVFGGEKYILGLQKDTGRLELVIIKGTKSEYSTNSYEVTLMYGAEIEDLAVSSQLVMALSPSGKRAHTYQILGFAGKSFENLLTIEADTIKVLEDGQSLKVNSPLDGYEGLNYEYIYTEEGYKNQGMEIQEVQLGNLNLSAYIGKIITFDCYVPAEYEGSEALGMYYEKDVYYPDTAVSLYLESGEAIRAGSYKITGEYVENFIYHDDELNKDMIRPRIKIMEMN